MRTLYSSSRMARAHRGEAHRLIASDTIAAITARRTTGEITRQRLMPPAKQTTSSCSVCSRFSATRAATKMVIGRIIDTRDGRPRRVILRNTAALWPWFTIRSRACRLWPSSMTVEKATVARSVGPRS